MVACRRRRGGDYGIRIDPPFYVYPRFQICDGFPQSLRAVKEKEVMISIHVMRNGVSIVGFATPS